MNRFYFYWGYRICWLSGSAPDQLFGWVKGSSTASDQTHLYVVLATNLRTRAESQEVFTLDHSWYRAVPLIIRGIGQNFSTGWVSDTAVVFWGGMLEGGTQHH